MNLNEVNEPPYKDNLLFYFTSLSVSPSPGRAEIFFNSGNMSVIKVEKAEEYTKYVS